MLNGQVCGFQTECWFKLGKKVTQVIFCPQMKKESRFKSVPDVCVLNKPQVSNWRPSKAVVYVANYKQNVLVYISVTLKLQPKTLINVLLY